jgi:hypothetical protein
MPRFTEEGSDLYILYQKQRELLTTVRGTYYDWVIIRVSIIRHVVFLILRCLLMRPETRGHCLYYQGTILCWYCIV